jgi:hypothetical protein
MRDLSVSLANVGNAEVDRDNFQAAREAFNLSLGVSKKLLKDFGRTPPRHCGMWRVLWFSWRFYIRCRAKGPKRARPLLGNRHLGMPDAATLAVIESLVDSDRLVALCERIHDVKSWQELLA